MGGDTTGRGRSWAHVATDPAKNFLRRGCRLEQVFDSIAAWMGDSSTDFEQCSTNSPNSTSTPSTTAQLHQLVVGLGAMSSRLEAAWCRLIGRWDSRQIWADNGSKPAAARLARETHRRRGDADRLVRRSVTWPAMPHTEEAYGAGEICVAHVDLVASCNRPWRNADFADSEEFLVNLCRTPFYSVAQRGIEYWKQRADPRRRRP